MRVLLPSKTWDLTQIRNPRPSRFIRASWERAVYNIMKSTTWPKAQ